MASKREWCGLPHRSGWWFGSMRGRFQIAKHGRLRGLGKGWAGRPEFLIKRSVVPDLVVVIDCGWLKGCPPVLAKAFSSLIVSFWASKKFAFLVMVPLTCFRVLLFCQLLACCFALRGVWRFDLLLATVAMIALNCQARELAVTCWMMSVLFSTCRTCKQRQRPQVGQVAC